MERVGTVYISIAYSLYIGIAYSLLPDGPRFTGHWDRDDPPEMLEDGPGWNDVDEAIAWGRARAPRVLVRLGPDESTIYSAGEVRLTRHSDDTGPPIAEWPPAAA